jgi:serine/threonine protein kinase
VAQVVGGRYHLIAHLGGGEKSDVSLAKTDAASDVAKLCVVKRLTLGADAEPEVVAQFSAEARLSLRLSHANIVQALETGEDADGPFLVLEYLEGQTLARLRSRAHRRGTGVPRAMALHIVMAMAGGLVYAHDLQDEAGKRLKVVHRELSPDKVVVTYAGTTKLLAFSAAPPGASSQAGAPKASVAYMAPEQAKSAVILDARADVFAVGVILWELLAGKRMWEGMSEAGVLARLADDKPLPSLRSVVPDMPEALDAICAQALAKVRDDRFDSAVELRDAIEKVAKAPELKATTAEVAELVTSLFEEEREKMRATVDEALMRPAGAAQALPQLRPLPPTSSNKFVDVDTDPNLWAAVGPRPAPAAPQSPVRVVEVLRVEQAPSPDRRFALLVGGAVLIAFAVVAVVAITNDKGVKTEEKPVAVPAARPTASAVEPAASAFAEPEEVTIEVSVKPSAAKLFVDGVRTPSNPHRVKVVRGKFAHEVRAEAEGFETRTMTVTFDRDRSIDIALTPKPVLGGPPPRPAPPPSAAASVRPDASPQ